MNDDGYVYPIPYEKKIIFLQIIYFPLPLQGFFYLNTKHKYMKMRLVQWICLLSFMIGFVSCGIDMPQEKKTSFETMIVKKSLYFITI